MDYKLLENAPLFKDVPPEEINVMLQCLGTEERDYDKGETIFHAGDVIHNIGLVLTGRVQIENDDVWGNKSVMESVGPGFAFAESYACLPGEPLMVSAIAAEPSHILFLDTGRVLTTCPSACTHHNRLIQNLLYISSQKNLNLSRRIFHTSSKSIRGRLLSYLSFQASKAGSRDFCIPFNRQQLADYLSIDRSAMSAELGKVKLSHQMHSAVSAAAAKDNFGFLIVHSFLQVFQPLLYASGVSAVRTACMFGDDHLQSP